VLLQAGVRNMCASLPNVGEADRELGPALGAAVRGTCERVHGDAVRYEEPLWFLVMRNQVRGPLPFQP